MKPILVKCNGGVFVPNQNLAKAYMHDPLKEIIDVSGDYATWLELKLERLINEMQLMVAFADEREHECEVVDHLKFLINGKEKENE